ncbi:MAG: hypothetical protein GH159_03375 [Dehalococcoidia bacterium]|nr:hypothetical protein [Dehalococcoidia bacterium]
MKKLFGPGAVALLVALLASVVLGGCPYGAHPKELISDVLSDGDDTFVAYELQRDVGDHDVRLQKLDRHGDVLWDEALFRGDESRVGGVSMVAGDGGVLVAWEVYLPENGGEGPHDFDHATLASVDGDGDVRWQQDFADEAIQMVADGGGGVVMAWQDGEVCYARGVDSGGEVLWEEAIGNGGSPKLVAGGEGETFILWNDQNNHSFLVQKLDSNGQSLWPEEGVSVEYAVTAMPPEAQIVSDGAGGAIVAWIDEATDQPPSELRLQRIGDEGQDLSKTAVGGPTVHVVPHIRLVADEPLGYIVVWESIGDGIELRAMRHNLLSSYLWPEEGVVVCSALSQSPRFDATSDGKGGMVVIWIDSERRLYAQRLDYYGQKLWGDEGVLIAQGACELSVWVEGDSNSGFVVGWTSGFTTYHPDDSYIQKIDAEGNVHWGERGIKISP